MSILQFEDAALLMKLEKQKELSDCTSQEDIVKKLQD